MELVRLPSFAKLNLDLRVLNKRPDGYHELRTIFQTISLKDTLTVEFEIAKRSQIVLDSSIDIANNLVIQAAEAVLERLKVRAWVRFVLNKNIPIGAGLGGGSSNAATVLVALPALARKPLHIEEVVRLAKTVGSDVPFFLYGGTALGLGRGTELYPLPDFPGKHALVVASGIHVSTPKAYEALARCFDPLTSPDQSPILGEFQTVVWGLGTRNAGQLRLKNDFEQAVFGEYPQLASQARKLKRLGANQVRMTGSGSALFGLFADSVQCQSAADEFRAGTAHPVEFISRKRYHKIWRRALGLAAESSLFAG